jgi:perosamine synthetase
MILKKKNFLEIMKLSKKRYSNSDYIINKLRKALNFPKKFIPLHEPTFSKYEKYYINLCLTEGFVSSVGRFVVEFENKIKNLTGSKYATAVVNGTSALQIALKLCGINNNDEVLVPSITFIGSVNSIIYNNAVPNFVDSELDTLGIDPVKLEKYLMDNCILKKNKCFNKKTNRFIKAIIIVHVFGHSAKIDKLKKISKKFKLKIIEDAAEALGSYYKKKHLGTFGDFGVISFNGNKTITTGGGGVLLSKSSYLAKRAKHLTTTAKLNHKWEYIFNETGYNFRLPNINAALGLAQLEKLDLIIKNKRNIYKIYKKYFNNEENVKLLKEPANCKSNYWLQTLVLGNKLKNNKNSIIKKGNKLNIGMRPCWKPLHTLKHLKKYPRMDMKNSIEIYDRIINIPSSSHLKLK